MPRGGYRSGAGRKGSSEIRQLRELLAAKYDDDAWNLIITKLFKMAAQGNLKAVELLVAYRFGNPYAAPALDARPPFNRIIFENATTPDPSPQDLPSLPSAHPR